MYSTKQEIEMSYQEFIIEMEKLFTEACRYTIDQAGSQHFTDKMADLADTYPEHNDRWDNEC